MGPELRLCGYLVGIGAKKLVLSLCPPTAHFGAKMSCRQSLPGYKDITLIAPGVGASALVQGNDFILNMSVHKMKPYVGATGCPPRTTLSRAVYLCGIP